MPEDYEFCENKLPDRTYISKSFTSNNPEDDRRLRFISKVFDEDELHEFIESKGELVLHVTQKERQEVKAIFYDDNSRDVKCLTIQRFTKQTNKPHKKTQFTFSGESLDKIYKLLKVIKYLRLEHDDKDRLDDELLDELLISTDQKRDFLMKNVDLIEDIVEKNLTKSDVMALAYRKEQLEIFEKLLYDDSYFSMLKNKWGKTSDESVWQNFFENNPWIFGYGLNYIYLSQLDDEKLEQVVAGYNFTQGGKRIDALLKTKGVISSLCFVEIKTHKTDLLQNVTNPYRVESWRISNELSGAIAQTQKTVQKSVNEIKTKTEFTSEYGEPTGEIAFLYHPKSYVVIGNLSEFMLENGINEQKFSSFELYRRNIISPEIITFDELFERAKYIVKNYEKDENVADTSDNKNNIPF